MSFLRSLLDDLVAKRLWPIALALLITAVAVPVVLGHGGKGAGAAPAASVPADGGATATPAVRIVAPASDRSRPGKVRDPFRRTVKAAAQAATVDGAPAPPTSASGATTSARSGGTKAPAVSPSTSTSTSTGATKPATATEQGGATPASTTTAASVYRPQVRWGKDKTAAARGVSRLEPLGGTTNPALLYLGTTADHSKAIFLLGPDATADGEGECGEPSCRVIELKPGQSTAIGVLGADLEAERSYTLTVDAIAAIAADSEQAAAELRTRVHSAGRATLRALIKDPKTAAAIGRFTYDRRLGAVVPITGT
jgi:hypothetical protein